MGHIPNSVCRIAEGDLQTQPSAVAQQPAPSKAHSDRLLGIALVTPLSRCASAERSLVVTTIVILSLSQRAKCNLDPCHSCPSALLVRNPHMARQGSIESSHGS